MCVRMDLIASSINASCQLVSAKDNFATQRLWLLCLIKSVIAVKLFNGITTIIQSS